MARKKFSPRDIGKRTHVKKGTKIRMLEGALTRAPDRLCGFVPILPWGNQWVNLFQGWLKEGARIEVYVQGVPNQTKDMLKRFAAEYGPKSFLPIDFSKVPDSAEFKKADLISKHFTLFQDNRRFGKGGYDIQMWTEEKHNPGNPHMYGCEYVHKTILEAVRKKEPWETEFRTNESILNYILKARSKKSPKRESVGRRK